MPTSPLEPLLQHLRRAAPPPEAGLTDGQVLELFLAARDEAAFAQHRQVLGNGGARHLEGRSNFRDRPLTVCQHRDDRTPRRIGKSAKHRLNIS